MSVYIRKLSAEAAVERVREQWARDAARSFEAHRTDGPRGYTHREILEQFTPAAQRLAQR